jgi:hypothetical protein
MEAGAQRKFEPLLEVRRREMEIKPWKSAKRTKALIARSVRAGRQVGQVWV